MADKKTPEQITIKKYANRRLYNTATSKYVTLDDLAEMVNGKAGRSRWLGRRPRVRGVVMNPVDHPMGGGEGKSSGGHPRSRTGVLAKGYKTRSKKKASSKYIVERRKK